MSDGVDESPQRGIKNRNKHEIEERSKGWQGQNVQDL